MGMSASALRPARPCKTRGHVECEAEPGADAGSTTYGLLFDYNPNPMWLYDMDSLRFLRVNQAAVEHYGYSAQQFLEMSILDLQPAASESDPDTRQGGAHRLARRGDACLHRRADGTLMNVDLLSERVVFRSRPAGLVLVCKRAAGLRAEQNSRRLKRLQALCNQVHAHSVRARDREDLFKTACRLAVKQGGFRVAIVASIDTQALCLSALASASDSDARLALLERRIAQPDALLTGLIERLMAERALVASSAWEESAVAPGPGACASPALVLLPLMVGGQLVATMLLCAEDLARTQDAERSVLAQLATDLSYALDYLDKSRQLHDLRYYDVATGLANRSLLLEKAEHRVREAMERSQGLSLCLLDLERFKHVNDHLGRDAGDALLRQVGTWLKRCVGTAGLVARVGVDQFAVLLSRATGEAVQLDPVEKMLAGLIKQPFRVQDSMLRLSARAGVAFYPEDGPDPEGLYRHAEAALKQAKLRGDRCLRYCREMSETAAERMNLETRLRQALERGEFLLHYQPKLCLHSGTLSGAEALIRWQDPREGLVSPARFIPVLEQIGLIHEVGAWAIGQAMLDAQRWRQAGHPAVRIAVNVSPVQLRNPGFLQQVWRNIATAPQSPADLELEITESVIMDGIQQNIAVLQSIREMGVRIAIDDFGTGFSSLSYLSRLPVDALKIDRSFVVDMTAGPQGLALVSTIINLAHSLKLKVVAEGVETDEQSRLLRLLNCDQWQGYLCSRPLAADAFQSQFLATRLPGVAAQVSGAGEQRPM